MKDNYVFDTGIIKSCTMDTFRKRLWGAWQVLNGKAGIVFIEVKHEDFYFKD